MAEGEKIPENVEHGPPPETSGSDRPAMPVNYEAEMFLLANILQRNGLYDQVADRLKPEHFADPWNERIYALIQQQLDAGKDATAVTIHHGLGGPQGLGDQDQEIRNYLAELQSQPLIALNISGWVDLVVDCAKRRELIQYAEETIEQAGKVHEGTASEVSETLLTGLLEAQDTFVVGRGAQSVADIVRAQMPALDQRWKSDSPIQGVTTGLTDLDEMSGGFVAPEVTVLAGRPSMGKSALATSIAFKAARAGQRVVFFSMEMSADQIAERYIGAEVGVAYSRLRTGKYGMHEAMKVQEAAGRFDDMPLWIDDATGLTAAQIQLRARRLNRKHGIDLIVIDHIGYIQPPDRRVPHYAQKGDIMKALAGMGKALNVPVLVLCQLSRASVQDNEDKRPQLHHLRESGQIEEDADAVWFIHREHYYLTRRPPKNAEELDAWEQKCADTKHVAEIQIAKARQGPVGIVKVYCDVALNIMADLAEGA